MASVKKPVQTRVRTARKPPVEGDLGFHWGRLNTVLMGLGLVALLAGYLALARGSTTLAPVLLVTGYCGLVPAALLVRRRSQGTGE